MFIGYLCFIIQNCLADTLLKQTLLTLECLTQCNFKQSELLFKYGLVDSLVIFISAEETSEQYLKQAFILLDCFIDQSRFSKVQIAVKIFLDKNVHGTVLKTLKKRGWFDGCEHAISFLAFLIDYIEGDTGLPDLY
eukprot:UN33858